MIQSKIKSSALNYVLVLSTTIALLLGGLVLLSSSSKKINQITLVKEIVRNNSISGIEYARAFLKDLPLNKEVKINLFGTGIDSVILTKKQWGAFYLVISNAYHKNIFFQKNAMLCQKSDSNIPNLYLTDLGSKLTLCGKTELIGNCILPQKGVKRGYIAGQNYIGSKLLYGKSSKSNRSLPEFNKLFIASLFNYFTTQKLSWKNQDTIINSFKSTLKHYYSTDPIILNNSIIYGQVIIESEDSIIVSNTCDLSQIILKSPIVHFESGFEGSVQVFATKKIILHPHSKLKYPSVVGLSNDNPNNKNVGIELLEDSQVIGSVFLINNEKQNRNRLLLNIERNAKITGLAYCQGSTQLKGEVNGHLLTDKFYLKTAASSYENYLLNAKVNNRLPNDFLVIPLLNESEQYKILEWVN